MPLNSLHSQKKFQMQNTATQKILGGVEYAKFCHEYSQLKSNGGNEDAFNHKWPGYIRDKHCCCLSEGFKHNINDIKLPVSGKYIFTIKENERHHQLHGAIPDCMFRILNISALFSIIDTLRQWYPGFGNNFPNFEVLKIKPSKEIYKLIVKEKKKYDLRKSEISIMLHFGDSMGDNWYTPTILATLLEYSEKKNIVRKLANPVNPITIENSSSIVENLPLTGWGPIFYNILPLTFPPNECSIPSEFGRKIIPFGELLEIMKPEEGEEKKKGPEKRKIIELESEEKADNSDRCCVICMEGDKQWVAMPCRHVLICSECNAKTKLKSCCICRAPIETLMQIFF